jgi:hypothetical protein
MSDAVRRQVLVEIEDITQPATFSNLPDALAALWESLRVLPLDGVQMDAYRYFFGEGAEQRVRNLIEHRGEVLLAFEMAGRAHAVRVRLAGAQAVR